MVSEAMVSLFQVRDKYVPGRSEFRPREPERRPVTNRNRWLLIAAAAIGYALLWVGFLVVLAIGVVTVFIPEVQDDGEAEAETTEATAEAPAAEAAPN